MCHAWPRRLISRSNTRIEDNISKRKEEYLAPTSSTKGACRLCRSLLQRAQEGKTQGKPNPSGKHGSHREKILRGPFEQLLDKRKRYNHNTINLANLLRLSHLVKARNRGTCFISMKGDAITIEKVHVFRLQFFWETLEMLYGRKYVVPFRAKVAGLLKGCL